MLQEINTQIKNMHPFNLGKLCALMVLLANPEIVVLGQNTYVVAFLGQVDETHTDNNDSVTYEVVITNPSADDVIVNITGQGGLFDNLTIPARSSNSTEFDASHALYGSQYKQRGSWTFASSDHFTLQVFVYNHDTGHNEGYLGIPVDELIGPHDLQGYYEYIVATFCGTSGYCQFAIAPLEDDTRVSVTLPPIVEDIVFCMHGSMFHTKNILQLQLSRYSALQIETTMDLSGTRIYSRKPIVVFVGARNLMHKNVTGHVIEQLFMTSNWGTNFFVRGIGRNDNSDVIKIAANWANTKVEVHGHPEFVIANYSHVVTRRLPNNRTIHIKAEKTIQIIQISGLVRGAAAGTFSPGMVVLSSPRNHRSQVVGFCRSKAYVQVLTNQSSNLSVPAEFVEDVGHHFKMSIVKLNTTGRFSLETTNNATLGGIIQCGDSITMPLHCQHYSSNASTDYYPTKHAVKEDIVFCREGQEANTTPGTRQHVIDISLYKFIRVRVQACGTVMFKFDNDMQLNNSTNTSSQAMETVLFEASKNRFAIMHCSDNCSSVMSGNSYIRKNEYNRDVNCTHGMTAYWFRLKQAGHKVCSGPGPFYNRHDTCVDIVAIKPNRLTMTGLDADAYFNYDLENDPNRRNIQGWRCGDFLSNCTSYGAEYCNSTLYPDFTDTLCPRYCGTCHPDSYGRDFRVVLPSYTISSAVHGVEIYVTSVEPNAKIFVGVQGRALAETRINNKYTRYEYTYKIWLTTPDVMVIMSDKDVSVSVYISTASSRPLTFVAYPTDTFALVYIPIVYGCDLCHCNVVSLTGTEVEIEYANKKGPNGTENQVLNVTASKPAMIDHIARRIIAKDPIGVFCGTIISPALVNQSYYQLVPADMLSTRYLTPKVSVHAIPLNVTLVVRKGETDICTVGMGIINDTNVHITMLNDTWPQVAIPIDTGESYEINSFTKISVGMYLQDETRKYGQFFPILPVSGFTRNTNMTFPMSYLGCNGYNVSDITTYIFSESNSTQVLAMPLYFNDTTYVVHHEGPPHSSVSVLTGNGRWFVFQTPGQMVNNTKQEQKPVCVTSFPEIGDNLDNDCDGKIDEDTCALEYGSKGEDKDLDGAYNEDCNTTTNSSVVISAPTVSECSKRNDSSCWTTCKCPCSWKNNKEKFDNMTAGEKQEFATDSDEKYRKILQIEKEFLSKTKYTKTSAPDHRHSSKGIGFGSIGLIVCCIATIVIIDMKSIINAIFIFWGNLCSLCTGRPKRNSPRELRRRSVIIPLQRVNPIPE